MSLFFSHSGSIFSKDDEEKEIAALTRDEREAAINDMYGRQRAVNNNNDDETELQDVIEEIEEDNNGDDVAEGNIVNNNINHEDDDNRNEQENNDDDEDDISGILIQQFTDALQEISEDERLDYDYAEDFFPDIMESESSPFRFLRCTNYNPRLAAIRLCEYWKLRLEIFGEDAFMPMTLQGAMKDVIPLMPLIPNMMRILPNDAHGRTVICFDKTSVQLKEFSDATILKIIWFVFHKALERRSTQANGAVIVIINRDSSWTLPSRNIIKLFMRSMDYGLPLKICCKHPCLSSLVASFVAPVAKFFMSRDARLRLKVHSSVQCPTLLNELETFGLHRDNLPKSIGGTYDVKPTWIDECEHILNQQHRRNKRQRSIRSA